MKYKPVKRSNKSVKAIMADPKSRAIYEATKLQIDLTVQLKKAKIKKIRKNN